MAVSIANFNVFDWFLVVLMAWSIVAGFTRGLIRTILGLVGIVLGFVFACAYYTNAGEYLFDWIRPAITARIIGFLAIEAITMLAFMMIGKLLRRIAKTVGLGPVDAVVGGAMGFIRGIFLGLAAMMVLLVLAPDAGLILESQTCPYFLAGAHAVSFVVPYELERQMLSGASTNRHPPAPTKQP